METDSQHRVTTPSHDAISAIRQTEQQTLQEIDGVGSGLATRLLDGFGSRYGVQKAAAQYWDALTRVDGIDSSTAAQFHKRMIEADVTEPPTNASTDAIRRKTRAELNRQVGGGLEGNLTILAIEQVVTGTAVPSLRIVFEPVTPPFDSSSIRTPSLSTLFPQKTQAYQALLRELELPADAWECSPEKITQDYQDRILSRVVSFEYDDGFVVVLDSEQFHI